MWEPERRAERVSVCSHETDNGSRRRRGRCDRAASDERSESSGGPSGPAAPVAAGDGATASVGVKPSPARSLFPRDRQRLSPQATARPRAWEPSRAPLGHCSLGTDSDTYCRPSLHEASRHHRASTVFTSVYLISSWRQRPCSIRRPRRIAPDLTRDPKRTCNERRGGGVRARTHHGVF